ncbi:MAG: ATP-binding protein [Candidatus Staskawiczbacteria bacterium]|nr:ATP-binding protein [Candidatus Staskawiczbacteria bacterium]
MNWFKTSQSETKDKVLVVCRSPSGCGKSTLAQELGKGGVVFSTDDFWRVEGEYRFDVRKLGIAHEWNRQRAEKAMQEGISPVVIDIDNTNIKHNDFLPYLQAAKKYGYSIKYAEPSWHPDLKTPEGKWNIDFINKLQKERLLKDKTKNIPEDVVKGMVNQYEYKNPGETDEELTERIFKRFE